MSDDDRDNDIESDHLDRRTSVKILGVRLKEDQFLVFRAADYVKKTKLRKKDDDPEADKRAHHNALERKRRDHIKDSFTLLRDALPFFQADKVRLEKFLKYLLALADPNRNRTEELLENSEDTSRKRKHEKRYKTSNDDDEESAEEKKHQASRAQILKKAADYITSMRKKNSAHQQDIDDLKRQNRALEEQIRSLEKNRNPETLKAATAAISAAENVLNNIGFHNEYPDSSDSDDSSENSQDSNDNPRKRLKSLDP